ncbi:MAG TPA: hypothetical protein VEJ46_17595 [Candidatus Acidoferrum sp.]|nr:hypothetical protein [Candidatus Acidoferrum sp.]
MRNAATLCGLLLIFALGTEAQVRPASSLFLGASLPALAAATPSPTPASLAAAEPSPLPDPPEPQGVYGVMQNFNFQAYAGFTYVRFYELPSTTGNLDGFNISIVYYPHAGHWGLDGEFAAAFAPQNGVNTTLDAVVAGGRFRLSSSRGVEVWVHALGGGAHFTPKTVYGGTGAVAFEAGGGIDLTPKHRRFAYRAQADVLGTYFFGTYQYNPKVSLGIVYKF